MARRPQIVSSSEDDEDLPKSQQPKAKVSEQEGGGSSRAPQASKTRAPEAWKDQIPKKRKPADNTSAGKSQKSEAKKFASKAKRAHQHRAPDMPLHTEDEDENEGNNPNAEETFNATAPAKKPTDRLKISEVSTGKAKSQHDKTNVKQSAQERKKAKSSEASGEEDDTDKDSGDQADKGSSESTLSDSGLEDLERKTGALEALFEAEAPTWVDQDVDTDAEGEVGQEPLKTSQTRGRNNLPSSPRARPDCDSPAAPKAKCPHSHSNTGNDSSVSSTKRHAKTIIRRSNVNEGEDDEEEEEDQGPPMPKKKTKQRRTLVDHERVDDRHQRRRDGHTGKERAGQRTSGKAGARAADGRSLNKPVGGGAGRVAKRKHNEDISWAEPGPNSEDQPKDRASPKRPRKQRRNVQLPATSDSELDSDVDSEDDRLDLIIDPGKQRLNLKEQRSRIQKVAIHAIHELEGHLCMVHAFPDAGTDSAVLIRCILANGAKAVGDSELRRMLKNEKHASYAKRLGSIPLQRLSLFRSKVKKMTDNMVRSFFGLTPGDVDKVRLLQDGIGYIYPLDRTNNTFQGDLAYSLRIFEEVLQAHFFSKSCSFGWRIADRFTSSLPDKPEEKEIPAAMLALVSTVISASIDDYQSMHFRIGEFKTNSFLDAYRQNMETLTSIKNGAPIAYHNIMHGLYVRVTGSERTGQGPAKSYLDVAAMAHRLVAA